MSDTTSTKNTNETTERSIMPLHEGARLRLNARKMLDGTGSQATVLYATVLSIREVDFYILSEPVASPYDVGRRNKVALLFLPNEDGSADLYVDQDKVMTLDSFSVDVPASQATHAWAREYRWSVDIHNKMHVGMH